MVLTGKCVMVFFLPLLIYCLNTVDGFSSCDTPVGNLTNCSARRLQKVPENINRKTKILDLSKNKIKVIREEAFVEMKNLQELYLQENAIDQLHNRSFIGLRHLTLLDLSHNKLVYSDDIFSANVFLPLESLSKLFMHKNIVHNSSEYPDRAIGQCQNLSFLTLDGVYGKKLRDEFSRLKKLSNLSLSCSNGLEVNALGRLYNKTFKNVKYIRYLTLSGCRIEYIESGTFSSLRNLLYLDISNNTSETPGGLKLLRNISFGLQNTKTVFLNVSRMVWRQSRSTYLKKSDLEFFKNTSIKELDASGNNIELLEVGALKSLPDALEILDISDNRFVFANYYFDILKMKNIRIIRANRLNFFHSLKIPSFSKRENKQLTSSSQRMEKGNQCSTCDKPKIKLPPKLEKIEIRFSGLHVKLDFLSIAANVTELDLHENSIYSWIGPLCLSKLKFLDLSQNNCENIKPCFFTGMTNLERLLIGRNFVGESLEYDINGKIFMQLDRLKELDIHRNRIYSLPTRVFSGLKNLEVLNVSENGLEKWDVDISHMTNLSYLDLHNNYLETLSEEMRRNLSAIAENNRNLSVNLFDNNLDCNCNNLEFFEWLGSSKIHFVDHQNYTCLDSTRNHVPIGNVKEVIHKLRKECSSYSALIVICSLCLGLFLALFTFGIVYRYRWKIRYVYYITWGRYSVIREIENKHYGYDAFVSYAADNDNFVKENLLPNLEEIFGLRLCIHDRDFTPGKEIATNIVNAIENSKKIIFLMSAAFLESYWCMFEFNMTRMEKIYSRGSDNCMFVIMLENLYTSSVPVDVLDLIQSHSYIEYPNDTQGNVIFWEKVKQTIIS